MRNAKVFITPLAANGAHRSGQYFNSILSSDNQSALKPEQFYGWTGALYESDFRPFYCLPCSIVQYDEMSTMSTTSNNILQLHIPIMSSMPTKNWNLWKSEIPQISKKPSGTPGVLQLVIGFLQTGACNLRDGHNAQCTMHMSYVHVHKFQLQAHVHKGSKTDTVKQRSEKDQNCKLQFPRADYFKHKVQS